MGTGAKQPIKPDDEVWYVQFKSGKEFGPVSQNTWGEWYRAGHIDAKMSVTTPPPTVDISRRPWMLIGPLLKHVQASQPGAQYQPPKVAQMLPQSKPTVAIPAVAPSPVRKAPVASVTIPGSVPDHVVQGAATVGTPFVNDRECEESRDCAQEKFPSCRRQGSQPCFLTLERSSFVCCWFLLRYL